MTVVRANTAEYTASPRCPHPFGIPGQREGFAVPASPQTRTWTRDARSGRGKRRSVIAEKTQPLPMFSAEGIRWDVLIVALTLVPAMSQRMLRKVKETKKKDEINIDISGSFKITDVEKLK